jgi:IclR family pca regulon transcriptional regulator
METQPTPTDENPSDFVRSLERGLAVIRAFGGERRELTLSEVARTAGLSRAATRRFLLTLVQLGYVESAGGRFSLRPHALVRDLLGALGEPAPTIEPDLGGPES